MLSVCYTFTFLNKNLLRILALQRVCFFHLFRNLFGCGFLSLFSINLTYKQGWYGKPMSRRRKNEQTMRKRQWAQPIVQSKCDWFPQWRYYSQSERIFIVVVDVFVHHKTASHFRLGLLCRHIHIDSHLRRLKRNRRHCDPSTTSPNTFCLGW